MARDPLADVIARHAPELKARPGVVAVAEGRTEDDAPCILVLVERGDGALPSSLDGWPVRVVRSDRFVARED